MPGRTVSSGATLIVSSGVTDIGDLVTDPGSLLIVASGGTTISTTIINAGTQEVSGGGVDSASTVSEGTEVVDSGGVASGLTVGGANAQLVVAAGGAAVGTFVFSDSAEIVSSGGVATVTDGTHTAKLAMLGSYVAANFHLTNDGHGGTLVSDPPVSSGSPIAPPH
jgi:autotransporter passenger strand-loop-strand repeat protein